MTGYGNLRRREQQRAALTKWVLIIAVLAAAGATAYWFYNPQQRPSWLAERLPTAPEATIKLYRWKDDSGQWVVTDDAPSDREYEVVEYRHDSNVLPFDPNKEQ